MRNILLSKHYGQNLQGLLKHVLHNTLFLYQDGDKILLSVKIRKIKEMSSQITIFF